VINACVFIIDESVFCEQIVRAGNGNGKTREEEEEAWHRATAETRTGNCYYIYDLSFGIVFFIYYIYDLLFGIK